jgi:coenzyme F420 biosynthesis associated uncharacterized protein
MTDRPEHGAEPPENIEIPKPSEGWWENVPVLRELYKLLSSTEPVNWELARQVGVALASEGEQVADVAEQQQELDAITRAAAVEAEEFSGLVAGNVADVRAVTRAEWVEANIDSFRFVMNPLAQKMAGGGAASPLPMQAAQILTQISGVFMGLQTGFVLGYMGQHVIGQYELALPAPVPPRLLYVVSNLEQMERDWSLDPKQFRYWIALHEITHHLEFSRPWVQNYFRSQLKTLIDSLDFDPNRMQSAFEGLEMLDPERMAEALQDPQRLIQAASTPLSSDATARLQAFMTLAEGYATFVMDAVGAKLLSDHSRLKEAMERRRQSVSPGDALLERLLGLELKRRQYEDGVKFCRYVAGMHDVESLNRAWENPDTLPTTEELADPERWIARVLEAGNAESPPPEQA